MDPRQMIGRKKKILGQGKNFYTENEKKRARENGEEEQRKGIAKTEYYNRMIRERGYDSLDRRSTPVSNSEREAIKSRQKSASILEKEHRAKVASKTAEHDAKKQAEYAGKIAQERGVAQTNRIIQQREYDNIRKEQEEKKAAADANARKAAEEKERQARKEAGVLEATKRGESMTAYYNRQKLKREAEEYAKKRIEEKEPHTTRQKSAASLEKEHRAKVEEVTKRHDAKEQTEYAGKIAQERGKARTNYVNQQREYEEIRKKNALKKRAEASQKSAASLEAEHRAKVEEVTKKRNARKSAKEISAEHKKSQASAALLHKEFSSKVKQKTAEHDAKKAAEYAGKIAQERGVARTNRIIQQREYDEIQKKRDEKNGTPITPNQKTASSTERTAKETPVAKSRKKSPEKVSNATEKRYNVFGDLIRYEAERGRKLAAAEKAEKEAKAKAQKEKEIAENRGYPRSGDAYQKQAAANAGTKQTPKSRKKSPEKISNATEKKYNVFGDLIRYEAERGRKLDAAEKAEKKRKSTPITPNLKVASSNGRTANGTISAKSRKKSPEKVSNATEKRYNVFGDLIRYEAERGRRLDAAEKAEKAEAAKKSTPVTPKQKVLSATDRTAKEATKPQATKKTAITPNEKKASATDRKAKETLKKAMLSKSEAEDYVENEQRKGIARTERTFRQQREQDGKKLNEIRNARKNETPVTPNQKAATEAGRTTKETPATKKPSGTPVTPNKKIASATDRTAKETPSTKKQSSSSVTPTKKKSSSTDRSTNVNGTLTKVKSKKKTSSKKPTEKSFTKSKKNVSIEKTKKTLKKAFNAAKVMRQRRAKAMQGRTAFNATTAMRQRREAAMKNRNPKNNPRNINLRGITKKGKKR